MSWTNLFKSKKAQPDPRLRWFGKLPTYADYYSSSSDEQWVIEFTDWIMKGYELLRVRQTSDPVGARALPFCAMAVRLPKSEMTVFAGLMDYGGDMRGRGFPMCFYVGLPSALWPGPTSSRWCDASRLMRELLGLRYEVGRFVNAPGRFDSTFGGRELDVSGIEEQDSDWWAARARSMAMEDWFAGARVGLQVDTLADWIRVSSRWGDNVRSSDSRRFDPTFRLPLSSRFDFEVQLAGWFRWLESRMDFRRRFCSVFVVGAYEEPAPNLLVVARDLLPEDFLLMTPYAGNLAYVDDLCGAKVQDEASPGTGAAADGGAGSPSIEASGLNWHDFACAVPTHA